MRFLKILALVAAVCLGAGSAQAQNTLNYMEQGGGKWVIGGALVVDGETVAKTTLSQSGRGSFTICGEATTVNNNTIYYGPDATIAAAGPGGMTCNIDAVGNATEATADAPVFTDKAVYPIGMVCRNEADANANITFTLRNAAGPTEPPVTCTIADNDRSCVADIQTTAPIAAGAAVAVAVNSTSNVADNNGFVCDVAVAY